jgi:hypothetical protein
MKNYKRKSAACCVRAEPNLDLRKGDTGKDLLKK